MKLGLIGLGTVGEGFLKIIAQEKDRFERKLGEEIEVVKVCDLEEKEFPFGKYDFTNDYKEILANEEIDTVVELIGGVGVAFEIAKTALGSGKNYITANKHLVAVHGKELFEIAKANGAKLFYEASVAGGIPILSPLTEILFPNRIKRIRGILNGTCNYMLTQMEEEGLTFEEALKDAQEKGYAEADPTFDVEGIDTAHKINILAYLAWGELKDFSELSISGIEKLRKSDLEKAAAEGKRYKLLGEAYEENGEVVVKVSPQLVEKGELLHEVGGVYNAIEVEGTYTGKTVFYGEGAGMDATAASVVSDLYKIIASRSWH